MIEDNSIKLRQIKERWCAIFVDSDTEKPCIFRFADALKSITAQKRLLGKY